MKKLKNIKITKDQILNIERTVRRNIEIEEGTRCNMNRVHKSAKTYTRKPKHKNEWV
jgi:hypothetical protein